MKFLLKPLATAIVALIMVSSCSVESLDSGLEENLRNSQNNQSAFTCTTGTCGARLTHNGTLAMDLTIYNHDNTLLFEQTAIAPGTETDWQYFPIGEISFTVTTPSTGLSKTVVINMGECMVYDMVITEIDRLLTDQATQGGSN